MPNLTAITATFSIVAADPDTGCCGVAVASKYPAVGNCVPFVRAGVGAFCTQAWCYSPFGKEALDRLEAGALPEAVLAALLEGDELRDKRQLALIDVRGRVACRNPSGVETEASWWGGGQWAILFLPREHARRPGGPRGHGPGV
ncbi:MAG: DUF1028 domain-containing protein [Spirochaetes bacterium]|nr:DUF1028 domain-containing protein [Spirochaetota bacterium]